MNLGARVREALCFWRCNPGQGVLGALGIVLGVFGLVVASAIGGGVRSELAALADELGVGLLLLESDAAFDSALGQRLELALGTGLASVATYSETEEPVQIGRASLRRARIVLAGEDFAPTLGIDLLEGRWLAATDVAQGFDAVVVSESLAAALAPLGTLLGHEISIGARWLRVVGIAADDGAGVTAYLPARAHEPMNRAALRFRSNAALERNAELVARSAARALPAAASLELVMPLDALREEQRMRRLVSTVLTVLAIVVLALGGAGVSNTMLMSVITRRAEIGLRRALGATTAEIVLQFILESAIVCAIGGGLAIALSAVFVGAVGRFLPWPVLFDLETLAGAVFAISVVSLAAGGLPALRAAKLPPADVLA